VDELAVNYFSRQTDALRVQSPKSTRMAVPPEVLSDVCPRPCAKGYLGCSIGYSDPFEQQEGPFTALP
jgi:hypothetical protein